MYAKYFGEVESNKRKEYTKMRRTDSCIRTTKMRKLRRIFLNLLITLELLLSQFLVGVLVAISFTQNKLPKFGGNIQQTFQDTHTNTIAHTLTGDLTNTWTYKIHRYPPAKTHQFERRARAVAEYCVCEFIEKFHFRCVFGANNKI